MNQPAYPLNADDLTIDASAARAAGAPFAQSYQSGKPYHHICIDNFLPEAVLEKVIQYIASLPAPEGDFNRAQARLKTSYNPDRLAMYTRSLFHAFNSKAFLLFLEDMTGIKDLIPDPYFMGAGVHRVANGGHLDIHADFNLHGPMQLERGLNVLIYLNHDWKVEFGGSFEIWDNEMTTKLESFVPFFNRMCCFSTRSNSMHGNPEPVNHPDGENRHSIALYHYTATWGSHRKAHSTLFKPRPGTKDQTDRMMARRAITQDLIPPILYRRIAGKLRKLGF